MLRISIGAIIYMCAETERFILTLATMAMQHCAVNQQQIDNIGNAA